MSESAELYTIGEAARRVGVPTRTIRFWCDSGVLPPAERSAGGYRRYDAAALARLDLVRTLRDLGIGLDDIREVLRGRKSVAELADVHVAALDAQIRMLRVRRSVLRTLPAELPDDPTPEQVDAWIELAGLVADEEFGRRAREMVLAGGTAQDLPEVDYRVITEDLTRAVADGIDPASSREKPSPTNGSSGTGSSSGS